jgi:hypothetical protein
MSTEMQVVKQKVKELQVALRHLDFVVETRAFGIQEWCEDLDTSLSDLEEDLSND